MKRLVLVAAVFAVAACAKKDEGAIVDSSAAMAPAPAPAPSDSAMKADSIMKDSITKDSIRKADSAAMKKP